MGRTRKKNKHGRDGAESYQAFAMMLNAELEGLAYRELSHSAAKAYPIFKMMHGKVIKKAGFTGAFDFTYSEAEKFGFARRTFSRIISELIAHGFIDIVEQGGKKADGMSNTKYKLSQRWRDFGKTRYDVRTGRTQSVFIDKPRYPSEPDNTSINTP